MKKYINGIILIAVILVTSAVAFLCGGEVMTQDNNQIKTEIQMDTEVPCDTDQCDLNMETQAEEYHKEIVGEIETTADSDENVEETENLSEELTCILSVRCDTILDNISRFDKAKADIVPEDGIVYYKQNVVFYEGESVFNVLAREMKQNKIHMEFEMSPIYETAYIKAIANIYEFDAGELSGWLYKVNNESPGVGCSQYKLKKGDVVEWVYTCDSGNDIGG